jgi:hypothetical protein
MNSDKKAKIQYILDNIHIIEKVDTQTVNLVYDNLLAIVTKYQKDNTKPKQSIPKKIKQLVWNKYIGEKNGIGKCLCCQITEISQMSFQCGHIISEKNGGDIKISNLVPICPLCNTSMGSTNMREWIVNHGLKVNKQLLQTDDNETEDEKPFKMTKKKPVIKGKYKIPAIKKTKKLSVNPADSTKQFNATINKTKIITKRGYLKQMTVKELKELHSSLSLISNPFGSVLVSGTKDKIIDRIYNKYTYDEIKNYVNNIKN